MQVIFLVPKLDVTEPLQPLGLYRRLTDPGGGTRPK